MGMLTNRNLKLLLAMVALVVSVFVLESGERYFISDVPIVETEINFKDQQKYKLADGNVGLPVLYLEGSMKGIKRNEDVELKWTFNGKSGKLKCNIQGATSSTFPKKNYTIRDIDQAIDVGWGLRKKYTLKADYVDCSHARNVVGAKLWGQIVRNRTEKNGRLQVLPNGGAIDGMPIYLVLNGKYNGVYNLCLSKDKNLFGMTKGTGECILASKTHGTLGNFKEKTNWNELKSGVKFQIKYAGNKSEWIVDSINSLVSACENDDNEMFIQGMDVDSAIDYYIHACMIGNCDGTDKNYLLSTFDGKKWFLTPYDMDATFGNHWAGHSYYSPEHLGPTVAWYHKANGVMHMVYKFHKDKLKARYAQLRKGVLSEVNVMSMIYNYMAPIPEAMKQEEYKLYPKMPGTNTNTAAQMVEWYRLRCIAMDKEMDAL